MIISYNTLLLIVKPHAMELDIGITIKSIPVSDSVTEVDVVSIIIYVSNVFTIVVSVSCFLSFFFDL